MKTETVCNSFGMVLRGRKRKAGVEDVQQKRRKTDIEYKNQRCLEMGQDMKLRQDMETDDQMEDEECSKPIVCCGNGTKNIAEFEGRMMAEALQGFIMYINRKGKILFVSNSVEEHLGLKQTMLMGRSVLDVIHQSDHKELGQQFQVKMSQCCLPEVLNGEDAGDDFNISDEIYPSSRTNTGEYVLSSKQTRIFYVRMKYNMHHNGNKTKHTGFMLVQWSGRLKIVPSPKPRGYSVEGMICVCRPVQTNSILEIRLDGNMFMSRHDLDMKFTFCDPRIITLIGYEPREVIGRTAYYFHNPLDAQKIQSCHSNLIVKGNSVSKYYRFCGKNGDWIWMQTRATIIYNTSNKPQYVVCMNYVIGEEEGQRCLMMEQEQPGLSAGDSKGFLDLTTHCKSLEEFEQDGGYSTMSPANSPLYGSTSSELSPSNCFVESGDEFMVDTHDMKLSPSYIEDNTLSPVHLPLSTSFSSPGRDTLSSSSDRSSLRSSDYQPVMSNYDLPASPFSSSSNINRMSLSQNNISDMETSSVFQNDSDFSDSSLQQDSISTGVNDPFLSSQMKEESLVSAGAEFEFIDEFLNEVNTSSCLKAEDAFQSFDPAADQRERSPLSSCEDHKEPSLLRSLLNKGCSSPSSTSSIDSPSACSSSYGRSSTTSPQMSPGAAPLTMPGTPEESLVAQAATTTASGNISVGMLNPVDVPPSFSESDSYISDDILDFAMLYCDSIADEQARLVMHDLGQVIGSDSWPNGVDEFITTMADAQNFSNESIATVAAMETVTDSSKSVGVLKSPVLNSANKETIWGSPDSGSSLQNGLESEKKGIDSCLTIQNASQTPKLNSEPGVNLSQNKLSKNAKVIFSTKGSQTSFGRKTISVPVTQGLQQKVVSGQNVMQKREKVNYLFGSASTTNGATGLKFAQPKVNTRSSTAAPLTLSRQSYQTRFTKANAASPVTSRSLCSPSRPRSMTELEKHLRGLKDDEMERLQKKQDRVSGRISRLNISDLADANDIPFLQMLLTGELSQDKYYKIDRELISKEKKKAVDKPFSSNIKS